MTPDRYQQFRRAEDFPGPIQELAQHNVAVRRIMDEYIHGNICFLNEALAQMVLILAKDWKAAYHEQVETLRQFQMSPFVHQPKI